MHFCEGDDHATFNCNEGLASMSHRELCAEKNGYVPSADLTGPSSLEDRVCSTDGTGGVAEYECCVKEQEQTQFQCEVAHGHANRVCEGNRVCDEICGNFSSVPCHERPVPYELEGTTAACRSLGGYATDRVDYDASDGNDLSLLG